MQTKDGVITVVQESRFQLMDDAGIYHLFVLAHGAVADPADLAPLQQRQARVRVRYRKASDLIAHVAYRIDLCREPVGAEESA
jgi:hypothetical protein